MKDCYGHTIPKSAYIIRATEVQDFLNCPRKWFIHSHNGMNLEPVVTNKNLRLGSLWHRVMEWYYNPDSDAISQQDYAELGLRRALAEARDKLEKENPDLFYTQEIQDSLKKDEALIRILFAGYPQWARAEAHPSDNALRILAVEKRFLVPIFTPNGTRSRSYLAVKLDAIAEDTMEHLWVVEHKTMGVSSRVADPEGLTLDLQMGLQLLALRRVVTANDSAAIVRGALYNLVRKQLPGPRVKSPIYGRHQVFRLAAELDKLELFLYETSHQMREASKLMRVGSPQVLGVLRYNPQVWSGGMCTWPGTKCRSVCEAACQRGDVEHLLDVEFRPRSRTIWEVLADELSES